MTFHSIRWRIAIPYALLILVVMTLLVFYLSSLTRDAHLSSLREQLLAEARLIGEALAPSLAQGAPLAVFDPAAYRYARLLGTRVTVIGPDGTVLGESHESRAEMDNHLQRPEVQQALAEGHGSSVRYSATVGYDMMYVAVRVTADTEHPSDEQVTGIVRVALPLSEVNAQIGRLRRAILLAALIVTLLAASLSVIIAERTARPVRQLTRVAERMADGDLNARLFLSARDETGQLARAFNHMADQLREKVTSLAEEQSRLSAILEGMADGVIITDGQGRVRLINSAAARLLDTDQERALGRSFAQVVRQYQLIELWQRCQERGEEQSTAVEMDHRGLFLQAIAKPFLEVGPQGYLVILQDLTRIRRLETIRRDFISNISHELRTPLAGLKALVDTLRDGALEDPPAAQRFLDRMDSEVDALAQMVEELLELSRIESGRMPLRLSPTSVADVVLPPLERLYPQAERADLALSVDLPADLPLVLAEEERVQRAVTNLVHNAIKFTPAGGQVTVSGRRLRVPPPGSVQPETWPTRDGSAESPRSAAHANVGHLKLGMIPPGDWVLIAVRDTGIGIPAAELDRIFERFYKADRARSGGGTGLGLAIAKHIVQAHGGHIWAESVEGEGSTFYFALPAV